MKKICCLPLAFLVVATLAFSLAQSTKKDSYYHFLRGSHLQAEGLLEEAEGEFLKAIQGSEDPAFILSTLAELYFEMWKWDKSEEAAKKALSIDPESIHAHRTLGQIYMSRALSIRGEAPLKRGLIQQAKGEFLKIINNAPNDEEAYSALGKISIALSNFNEAEQYYSRYTELNPFSDVGFFNLGELQFEQGKLSEALKNLDKALSINPRNYNGYLILGRTYELLDSWKIAATIYEKALEYFEDDILFLNRLSFSLYILEDYEKALNMLEKVFQFDPANPQALLTKAKILQVNGKDSEAESIYLLLIKSDEDNVEARLSYAFFLENRGDREAALAEYKALLKRDTDPPSQRLYFYNFRLGVLSERLNKYVEAEEYLRKAVESNPKSGEALNYLGYMLVEREEKIEEAVEFIKKALAVEPENSAYLDSLGWAYFKLKKYREAETYLKKALLKSKDDPIINDHLGDLYFRRNEKEKAVMFWRKALELNIDYKDEVKKKIEKVLEK